MKTTLYYFTGTGNSLAVARKIGILLGETDLVPIASEMQSQGDITAPAGQIGIICPVYDMGIPVLVRNFLNRLIIGKEAYIFAILTLGGTGAAALKLIDAGLYKRNGRGINAGFLVKMPGNFPPVAVPPTGAKQAEILMKAESECERIATAICAGTEQPPGLAPFTSLLQFLLYRPFSKSVHTVDEKFSVSDACNSCGICASVCPTGNITLQEGRPVYAHRCELCCACLNFCPTQAINLDVMRGTEGRGRYHHPAVTVADMRTQKGTM